MNRELLKRVIAECGDDRSGSHITTKLFVMIIEYLSTPEPEPVAWRALNFAEHGGVYAYRDHDEPFVGVSGSNVGEPLYTTPPDQSARIDMLKTALHEISLCSQNSMSSKEDCGRIARIVLSKLDVGDK